MKILISSPAFGKAHMKELIRQTESAVDEVVLNPFGRTMTQDEVGELWQGVDAIIAGLEPYTADFIQKAPETLKVISRFGVGYDSVDCHAAKDRGILVTNTPGVNADAVADLVFGMMIALARGIVISDKKVRDGKWDRFTGDAVNNKKLGILGLGAVGKGVAKRALGFEMEVYAFDIYFDQKFAAEFGIRQAEKEEIFRTCDFITLHLPVSAETEGIVNEHSLEAMKESAFLINAARGQLVDETALYEALKAEKIAGAALDVFLNEPLINSPLTKLDNVILLPHIGGNTKEAAIAMGEMAIDSAIQIINGNKCQYIVNQ